MGTSESEFLINETIHLLNSINLYSIFFNLQRNPLDKWMLDSTEGPHRMRKKTMRNDQFYLQYIYRPELEIPENVRNIHVFYSKQEKKLLTFN